MSLGPPGGAEGAAAVGRQVPIDRRALRLEARGASRAEALFMGPQVRKQRAGFRVFGSQK